MDLRKIKKLIELLEDSALVEMEITEGENTIRLSRASSSAAPMVAPAQQIPLPVPAASVEAAAPVATPEPSGNIVKSPMVATFYSSSSPEADPYVTVGSVVKAGDTLCVLEAMKTFNQVAAEFSGTVREIYKQSGEPVEFGEPLFLIEP